MEALGFNQFVFESTKGHSDTSKYADDIINLLKTKYQPSEEYSTLEPIEYTDPHEFDLIIEIKSTATPDFKSDSHFKTLQWEKLNFEKNGFAIDANTVIDKEDSIIPKVIVTLLVNPDAKESFKELKFKLMDIISHEIMHTEQVGWNRKPFKSKVSSNIDRAKSKNSFEYFLLPEEVEAMVGGMYIRSQSRGVTLDSLIDKYLQPFIKDKLISESEYYRILNTWILHALENYPDVKLSENDPKISKIINSI